MVKGARSRKVQVWIHHGKDRVLLLKTQPERGAFWQPVTGGVEEGESYEQAARREAIEETGLEFVGEPDYLDYEFSFDGRWGPATERVFAWQATHPKKPNLDPKEHQAFEWVTPAEAHARLKFPANAEGLRRLEARW